MKVVANTAKVRDVHISSKSASEDDGGTKNGGRSHALSVSQQQEQQLGSQTSSASLAHGMANGRSGNEAEILKPWAPSRLTMNLDDIHIVHFSGEMKFWDKDHLSAETDDDFVNRFFITNSPWEAALWLNRTADDSQYARYGLRREGTELVPLDRNVSGEQVELIVSKALKQLRGAALRAFVHWRTVLESLPSVLKSVESIEELLSEFGAQSAKPTAEVHEYYKAFQCGEDVEVYWMHENEWYPARVVQPPTTYRKGSTSVINVVFEPSLGFTDTHQFDESFVRRMPTETRCRIV